MGENQSSIILNRYRSDLKSFSIAEVVKLQRRKREDEIEGLQARVEELSEQVVKLQETNCLLRSIIEQKCSYLPDNSDRYILRVTSSTFLLHQEAPINWTQPTEPVNITFHELSSTEWEQFNQFLKHSRGKSLDDSPS